MSINHQCSKTSTIWLALSHLTAQRMGLENPNTYSTTSSKRAGLYQRLWWSIFTRDTTLRLELGTPQRFQDFSSYDCMPPLTEDCFDTSGSFSASVRAQLPNATQVQRPDVHRRLVELAVRRAELVAVLAQILAVATNNDNSKGFLPPSSSPTRTHEISVHFERALRKWCSGLENSGLHNNGEPTSKTFEYHCGLLSILYFSTSNALLQRHLQPSPISTVVDSAVRTKVERDTKKALDVAKALYTPSSGYPGSPFPPTLGMGLAYNAINLFVGLAEWRSTKRAAAADNDDNDDDDDDDDTSTTSLLLPLDPAIKCLCALIKSTPRGTAVEIALSHLESRIKALDSPAADRRHANSTATTILGPSATPTASSTAESVMSPAARSGYTPPQQHIFPAHLLSTTTTDDDNNNNADEEMSLDELFDMAVHSDRDFSPQPGFAIQNEEDEDEDDNGYEDTGPTEAHVNPSHLGILIPV